MYYTNFTIAKPSKDAIKIPPIITLKFLVTLSNKNNSNFWIRKGAMYHWTLHLKYKNKIIIAKELYW